MHTEIEAGVAARPPDASGGDYFSDVASIEDYEYDTARSAGANTVSGQTSMLCI
jgi:hypothetical protein